jgi:hypothetical protein
MSLLLDPKIFNYVILILYGLNVVRWTVAGSWTDAMYWIGAFWITAVVTFGYEHG